MVNPLTVAHGIANSLLGRKKDLSEERLEICYKCPLYSLKFGGMCNNKLWINPRTNELSTEKIDGYINGCGCVLSFKTTLVNESCPLEKW